MNETNKKQYNGDKQHNFSFKNDAWIKIPQGRCLQRKHRRREHGIPSSLPRHEILIICRSSRSLGSKAA
jgi:hypothetical protein